MAYPTPFSQAASMSSFPAASSMYLKSGGMAGAMGAYHMGLGMGGLALDPMHAYGNTSKLGFRLGGISISDRFPSYPVPRILPRFFANHTSLHLRSDVFLLITVLVRPRRFNSRFFMSLNNSFC